MPSQPAEGISRRAAVVWLGTGIVGAAAGVEAPLAASPPPAAPAVPTVPAASQAGFLAFSRGITGHVDLAPRTADRIHAAMAQRATDFPAQVQRLAELAAVSTEPAALLARASEAGLRDTALAVVAAWYTGTVGSGGGAVVVAYADALMYQPVRDAQSAPTYCADGPAWWTRDPPPIGVSPPVEKGATPSPTTGFPMPTTGSPPPPRTEPQRSAPHGGVR